MRNLIVKKILFITYHRISTEVSRSGIARRLLPLSVRRLLGYSLRQIINAVTPIDVSRPYQVLGHKMWLFPGSSGILQEMAFGVYEYDTVKVLQRLIKPGMTVVDIGAFVGFYTLLAAELVGTAGRVYAFEPNPQALELLLRNIRENNLEEIVKVIPYAVSNHRDRVRLFIKNEPGEASFYGQPEENNIEVETLSLDEFFAGEGWPEVHFIKLDVEGAEVKVMEGMKEVVRRNLWLKMLVEFNPRCQVRAAGNYRRFFELLLDLGFDRFYAIRGDTIEVFIPQDIQKLVQMTETTKYINLLCEISGARK